MTNLRTWEDTRSPANPSKGRRGVPGWMPRPAQPTHGAIATCAEPAGPSRWIPTVRSRPIPRR